MDSNSIEIIEGVFIDENALHFYKIVDSKPNISKEQFHKELEMFKLKAIQEYLLHHGANDEWINEQLRELQKQ